jgi:hypothetical protein
MDWGIKIFRQLDKIFNLYFMVFKELVRGKSISYHSVSATNKTQIFWGCWGGKALSYSYIFVLFRLS